MADAWSLPLVRHARFEFAEPTEEGVEYISENLREADREETYASSGHRQYHDTLRLGLAGSRSCVMALTACGEPVALLGVVTVSVLYSVGSPWMLATDRAYSFRRAFIECGRVYTAAMLGVYESLENHVDARNQRSIDWLRRLGYVIGPAKPYGALGLPFHLFRRGR